MNDGNVVGRVHLQDGERIQELFGERDQNLEWLEQTYGVRITVRDGDLMVRGPAASVDKIVTLLQDYDQRARNGKAPTIDELRMAAQVDLREGTGDGDHEAVLAAAEYLVEAHLLGAAHDGRRRGDAVGDGGVGAQAHNRGQAGRQGLANGRDVSHQRPSSFSMVLSAPETIFTS